MRLLLCAVIASMAAALPACSASKPDMGVSLEANPHWGNLMYNTQATADDVTIRDVVVNRGSCNDPLGTAFELSSAVKLKFGQTWQGYSTNSKVDNVKRADDHHWQRHLHFQLLTPWRKSDVQSIFAHGAFGSFAICWVFGIASCAVVQKAWPHKQGKWRFT
jgi:hypothetical protein